MLQKYGGDLDSTRREWDAHSQKDIWEFTSARQRKANDLHAQVDDLEVEIQQRISATTRQDNNKQDDKQQAETKTFLLRKANTINDEPDQAKGDTQSFPLDKVTAFIFRSARNKMERLIVELLSKTDDP